jgi:hypothetical protein
VRVLLSRDRVYDWGGRVWKSNDALKRDALKRDALRRWFGRR